MFLLSLFCPKQLGVSFLDGFCITDEDGYSLKGPIKIFFCPLTKKFLTFFTDAGQKNNPTIFSRFKQTCQRCFNFLSCLNGPSSCSTLWVFGLLTKVFLHLLHPELNGSISFLGSGSSSRVTPSLKSFSAEDEIFPSFGLSIDSKTFDRHCNCSEPVAVGSLQLAAGRWLSSVGSWQLALASVSYRHHGRARIL